MPGQRQDQALRRAVRRRPRLGQGRRPSASPRRFGVMRIDAEALESFRADTHAHALRVRRARPDRIRRRPFARRGQRARRPARPGHRSICRHARRAPRAGRRPRGARGDDGVVAQADGLARRVRAGRKRQRDRAGRRRRCSAGAAARRAPSRPRNCPSWWRRTAPPSSISRSARPTARATSPAPGSPSARGWRRRWRKFR